MDSKLVEEIEQHLDLCKRMGHESKGTKLLQRCLSAMKWIPVEERLPGDGQVVILLYKDKTFCLAKWDEDFEITQPAIITHWKPVD